MRAREPGTDPRARASADQSDRVPRAPIAVAGAAAACWGVLGHVALLAIAAREMLPRALDALAHEPLERGEWVLAAATVALLGYFMGYRGLHRSYAPLVVARGLHLARNPAPVRALVAPAYCVGLVQAPPRRRIASALLFAAMGVLALVVGTMPQPYRAIVELAVALGLGWGAIAVVAFSVRAFRDRPPGAGA